MNKLIISGNLGGDPQAQYFESGRNVAKFSVAVTNYKKETTWFTVECWGKNGEAAANHLRKGSSVIVEGEAGVECWPDRNTGEAKAKLVVKNARWEFAGTKQASDDECDDF